MIRVPTLGILFCLMVTALGCGGPAGFRPIEPDKVLFWDRQTVENADLLHGIVDQFNAGREGLPVEAQYSGGYSEIYRKVTTSIQARALPAMAVAYQSMTVEYIQAGAVVPLDSFISDPEVGLSSEELDDFFPVVLETNRFSEFGGQMCSFPFCKSVLMLYFNKRVLSEAGIDTAPATWHQFLEQCRQVKSDTGKYAYAIDVDASTFDGMIYSRGGDVIAGTETLFDSPASLDALKLLETLAKEKLGYQIPPGSYDDRDALAQDRIAFLFRSSSHQASVGRLMQGDMARWGIKAIPQADPSDPHTVLYGPNICIFRTTPEQERISWQFVKAFTSPETTVRWSLGTGYLPIRKSAENHPEMKAFWKTWEYNRAAFDCLGFARSEPNVAGWQEVRDLIENAQTAVLTGKRTAEQAAAELKGQADAVLAEAGG